MACNPITNVTKPGDCTPGYVNGMVIFKEKPTAVELESAKLLATWQALADVEPPDNLMYVKFKETDPQDPENVTQELLGGEMIIIDKKQVPSIFSVIADACALQGLYAQFENGQIVYGMFTTHRQALIGKYNTGKTSIEAIEFSIFATTTSAKKDAIEMVNLNVSPRENYLANRIAVGLDFNFKDVKTMKTMFATSPSGDSTANTLSLTLWECGHVPVIGAEELGFSVKDSNGDTVALTGLTSVGNVYTLDFTAIEDGTYTVSYFYDEISEDLDYLWLPATSVIATTP